MFITTLELVSLLKSTPDVEYECHLSIGHGITSPHWWFFDSKCQRFQHLLSTSYYSISQEEFLLTYRNCLWYINENHKMP